MTIIIVDPKVKGVSIYLADFERPINEKLTKDFFNDPSSSSLTCSKTGPIVVSSNIVLGTEGEEVFEESKNLFFKVSTNFTMYLIFYGIIYACVFAKLNLVISESLLHYCLRLLLSLT